MVFGTPAHFARMGPDLFEASGMSVECLVEARNLCGESPVWHAEHESVYWTDINGFKIYHYSVGTSRCRYRRSRTAVSVAAI
jgi:sugar lactone lactonase YvrE